MKAAAERTPNDAIEIEFDTFGEFEICAASFTPIYAGEASTSCPFDGSKYHTKYKGNVCKVCEVSAIGAPSSGLRLTV
jgi:coatomer protein complex subunit alpha (xenin)